MNESTIQDGQTIIRKWLIYSALNFINNPRIRSTSLSDKKLFLLKKGLTQDEIELTFELSTSRPSSENALKNEFDRLSSIGTSILSSESFVGKLFNLTICFTIFGGFIYGSYSFYQNIIRPYLDPSSIKSKRKTCRFEEINQKLDMMNQKFIELDRNVTIVQEFMRNYCRVRDDTLLSLKSDIGQIKSLLVNKNQFPMVPTIPKWQLDNSKSKSKDKQTNGDVDDNNHVQQTDEIEVDA